MKPIKEILFFGLVLVGLWILSDSVDRSGILADPIKSLYFWSGWLAFGALVIGLFMRRWGRFFGHCALVFSLWHLMIFIDFDFYFAWELMLRDVLQKYYLFVGILGLLIMLFLGAFSLFGRFYRFFAWLVFACIALSLAHIVMIQKVLGLAYWAVIIVVVSASIYKIWRLQTSNRSLKP